MLDPWISRTRALFFALETRYCCYFGLKKEETATGNNDFPHEAIRKNFPDNFLTLQHTDSVPFWRPRVDLVPMTKSVLDLFLCEACSPQKVWGPFAYFFPLPSHLTIQLHRRICQRFARRLGGRVKYQNKSTKPGKIV